MSRHNLITNNKIIISIFLFIAFYLVGCSTSYTVPKNSKVLVNKETLPTYNPKNFSNQPKSKKFKEEDEWIIKAIWLEEQHNFKESNKYYAKLYDATQKDEYLLKELNAAHYAGIISKNVDKLKIYSEKNPNNLSAKRLLLSFYIKSKQYDQAKEVGQKLTQQSAEAVDFELTANPYIFTANYKKAISFLNIAYEKTLNEDILLKIATIQINYLHDLDSALNALEEHRQTQGCSEKICLQLIGIYTQQQKIDKLIPIYKSLAQVTKKEIYIEKIIESYLYNQNIDAAISYLEKEYKNNALLYSLYMEKKSYSKAYALTKTLLTETHNPKWYAESAIALYESLDNKDDKTMLNKVVQHFQKALDMGVNNPIYLNYYGYTLIDKNLDLNKGVEIIKQALAQEPENTYYLDSIAWAYYKLDDCSMAYPTMKKVVEIEGLNEEEIIEHWNAINNKCKK